MSLLSTVETGGLSLWASLYGLIAKFWLYAVILIAIFSIGWIEGSARKQHAWDVEKTETAKKILEDSETLATSIDETRQKNDAAIASISAQRDAALQRVRVRTVRLPAAAAAACQGATGTELSRDDAGFLVRYAADAASTAANLTACYEREDNYRKAMIDANK